MTLDQKLSEIEDWYTPSDFSKLLEALRKAVELIDAQLDWDERILKQSDMEELLAILEGK